MCTIFVTFAGNFWMAGAVFAYVTILLWLHLFSVSVLTETCKGSRTRGVIMQGHVEVTWCSDKIMYFYT